MFKFYCYVYCISFLTLVVAHDYNNNKHLQVYLGGWDYGSEKNMSITQQGATLFYYKYQVLNAPEGSVKRKEALKELDALLSYMDRIDHNFHEIIKAIFGDENVDEFIKIIDPDVDWDCYRTLAETYEKNCGRAGQYGSKYTQVFANMCDAGVHQSQLAKVASQVCDNNSIDHDF